MTDQPNHSPSGLYAYTETDAINVQTGISLILDWWSDAQMLAAPSVAAGLQHCRRFRTLEQHTEVLTSRVPELAGQQADVMNVLGMVREAGLLVTAESVCDKLNADVPAPVDLPPSRVFVLTCDRPAAVERLLESMLRAGNLSHHEALFLIDDSRDPGNAARNRDLVENFNLTSPRDLHYFGEAEARSFMASLIDALPDSEEAIRFLIDRKRWAAEKTYGLARNLCLLLSVGKRAILMDDDVLCVAMRPPHRSEGVNFGSADREADFYRNHEEMLAQATPEETDPLTGHTSCLGLSMGQALRKLLGRAVTPADLAGANSSYLNLWDANAPLLITQCGTLGDPGTAETDWIYYAEGETARRLADFSGGVQGALASRSYWLGHPRPSFGKSSNMSQLTGLDNSTLLPPYFPIYRGEDALFGAMTEHMYPRAAVLSYDWAVPHLPVEERRGDTEPMTRTGKGLLSIPKYVTDRTEYREGATPTARLQTLAALASQLGETGDRGLKLTYRTEAAEMLGLELSKLESLLNNGKIREPIWQGWLEDTAKATRQTLQGLARVTDVAGVDDTWTESELLARFRDLASSFGKALFAWDTIRGAASELTSRQFS